MYGDGLLANHGIHQFGNGVSVDDGVGMLEGLLGTYDINKAEAHLVCYGLLSALVGDDTLGELLDALLVIEADDGILQVLNSAFVFAACANHCLIVFDGFVERGDKCLYAVAEQIEFDTQGSQ